MKRKITIAFLMACSVVAAYAQPKAKFSDTKFDLGNIGWHSQVVKTIKVTNSGKAPLTIADVETDCECTVANWSHDPIAPGSSSMLTITFDARTIGRFNRNVYITTNAIDKPEQEVKLTGRVTSEALGNPAEFPFKYDHVLLSSSQLDFGDVTAGDRTELTLKVMNNGKKDYAPEFMHLPHWLQFRAVPAVLQPGHVGHVVFTLDTNEVPSVGLVQENIYVARYAGDKVNKSKEMSVLATVLPNVAKSVASNEGAAESVGVPVAVIPEKVEMGKKFGKKKTSGTLYLENKGDATLHVYTLDVNDIQGISVSLSDQDIEPGDKATLKVNATSNVGHSKQPPRIIIITNDPKRQKIIIDLTAE